MKYNEINENSIKELMEVFYEKIREDDRGLGDIFNAKIGTDNESWKAHKAKIANFWCGMMLGLGDYAGNPMRAHMDLMEENPFEQKMFEFWLGLFKESLDEVYEMDAANAFYERAFMIGQRFQAMLYGGM